MRQEPEHPATFSVEECVHMIRALGHERVARVEGALPLLKSVAELMDTIKTLPSKAAAEAYKVIEEPYSQQRVAFYAYFAAPEHTDKVTDLQMRLRLQRKEQIRLQEGEVPVCFVNGDEGGDV